VAKSAAGKWVSRVGASGGGKAYKKSRPGNYYGALVVIVVLGLASTVFARYDYEHPASAASGTQPRVGTTWFAALSVEACGAKLAYLSANPASNTGLKIQAANVIRISPVSSADSGNNATLSQFAAEYPGLIASSTELAVPTAKGAANAKTTYRNGDACPAKSKYHGQTGKISYAYWTSFGQKKPTITTDPSSIKFVQYLRVTMAFEPVSVTPTPPVQRTVDAMVLDAQTPTTTTSAVQIPTSVPAGSGTTTSLASPNTTIPGTTTTAPKG
jgi:hypothetical protein